MKYKIIVCFIILLFCSTALVEGKNKNNVSKEYEGIVKELKKGNVKIIKEVVVEKVKKTCFEKAFTNKKLWKQILLICIVAAIFQNFSDAFFQNTSSDTSFYVTYIVLVSTMTTSFSYISNIACEAINRLNDYMSGFISSFCLALVSVSGVTSSTATYELYLGIIYAITYSMKMIFLPAIKLFYISNIINYMTKEQKISKLCDAMEWVMEGGMKLALGLVLGFQMLQSMILPHVDALKNSLLLKGASFIPGIGNQAHSISTTFIGAAVVIKNSIGVAGILLIILFLLEPLIQIGVVFVSYLCVQILLQPIVDGRILGVFDGMVRSIKLYFRMLISISLLFIISIAIIIFTTNVTYYAG